MNQKMLLISYIKKIEAILIVWRSSKMYNICKQQRFLIS